VSRLEVRHDGVGSDVRRDLAACPVVDDGGDVSAARESVSGSVSGPSCVKRTTPTRSSSPSADQSDGDDSSVEAGARPAAATSRWVTGGDGEARRPAVGDDDGTGATSLVPPARTSGRDPRSF